MAETNNVEAPEGVAENQEAPEFKAVTSQEELDQIISKRIARERKKYADYDELKGKAEKLHEIEQANLSETEKAVAEAVAAKEAELKTFYAEKLAMSEATQIAQAKGFHDPSDAMTFVNLSELVEDGALNTDALNEKLNDLSQSKPYLLATKNEEPAVPSQRRIKSGGTPVASEGDSFEAKLRALLSSR